ncbi:MAG: class I SAM-dependent methyltransferase [Hyphomicrobiales bacterium]
MDVVDLKQFYASPLGHVTRRMIAHRILAHVEPQDGLTVAGIGFATPYLEAWRDKAQRCLSLMPAWQGVIHWPEDSENTCALADETELPLPDSSVDLAIVAHALELTEHRRLMLRELWRVLAPEGRCLFVVPNRGGMWARADSTPFGHGRPFSRPQLTQLLKDALFTPVGWAHALYMPPVKRKFIMRSAPAWERMGLGLGAGVPGVIIVDAQKQVFAAVRGEPQKRLAPAFEPVALQNTRK